MSTATRYKQELPPPGGYGPIEFSKVTKPLVKAKWIIGILVFGPIPVAVGYFHQRKIRRFQELERQDTRLATSPFMVAERHRQQLKQLVINREAERELMKDNPYWTVGRLWNEPVYHNIRGRFIEPQYMEYYMHCKPKNMYARMFEHIFH